MTPRSLRIVAWSSDVDLETQAESFFLKVARPDGTYFRVPVSEETTQTLMAEAYTRRPVQNPNEEDRAADPETPFVEPEDEWAPPQPTMRAPQREVAKTPADDGLDRNGDPIPGHPNTLAMEAREVSAKTRRSRLVDTSEEGIRAL